MGADEIRARADAAEADGRLDYGPEAVADVRFLLAEVERLTRVEIRVAAVKGALQGKTIADAELVRRLLP